MTTRSPSRRAIGVLPVAALFVGAASIIEAQQPPPRAGQSPGPRFIVPTLTSDGSSLGFQVARAVRERIASDFEMRTLWVVPESTITSHLTASGYRPDQALSASETRQLVQQFRADELLKGSVFKTPSGGYRVEADWSLTPREDMVQPLPPVEAAKISDVAKLLAREFHSARRQVESVQRCMDLARARNFTGALAEARKAITAYPKSVLGRVCVANIYDQQKLGPDSMISITGEILDIHPGNLRALAFAADAYAEKGQSENHIGMLRKLVALDTTNRRYPLALVRALAGAGQAAEARPLIDAIVVRTPDNSEAVSLQWRVQLAMKGWAAALTSGEVMVRLDSSAATRDFFIRMIAAADALGDAAKALDLATRGVARFATDDELAMLQVQFLRRTGRSREALDVVNRVVARNPRAPNAWLQKAHTEADLGFGVDSTTASLSRAVEHGEARPVVSRNAVSLGATAARDSTAANKLDPLRTAIRYYKFAETVHATDTTSYFLGRTSLVFGQQAANAAREPRQCDLAKEAQSAFIDAQISLPKAGASFKDVPDLLRLLAPMLPYSDQLVKAVCR